MIGVVGVLSSAVTKITLREGGGCIPLHAVAPEVFTVIEVVKR